MPKEIKYGYLYGPRCIPDRAWPVAASVNFENDSGKLVVLDANDRVAIAVAADTQIEGWAETGDWTSSATAGADTVQVDISPLSMYRMPTSADPANTRGETADLVVTSNNQQVNPAASATDVITIVEIDTVDDTVDVHMTGRLMNVAGVA